LEDRLWVGAGLHAEDERLGDAGGVDRDQQLVDELDRRASRGRPAETDVLAEGLEDRQGAVERLLVAADHDRERAALRPGRAARDRRVEEGSAAGPRRIGALAACLEADGRVV